MKGITREEYEHLRKCELKAGGDADPDVADDLRDRGLVIIRERPRLNVLVITPAGRTALRCYEALHLGVA